MGGAGDKGGFNRWCQPAVWWNIVSGCRLDTADLNFKLQKSRGIVMGRGSLHITVMMKLYSRWRGGGCGGKHRMGDTVNDTVWCGCRDWNMGAGPGGGMVGYSKKDGVCQSSAEYYLRGIGSLGLYAKVCIGRKSVRRQFFSMIDVMSRWSRENKECSSELTKAIKHHSLPSTVLHRYWLYEELIFAR